ncbi:MAG: aldo/keto reductase family protein [Hamadaea sp.]|uniref:aldo/keto reductase family protein n=1 Tax=Hamadaea sp. TaxID=2024425 RepID=UPI0017A63AE4|nr:aldo/keto reductase family protein [Hamadaea sp.]NUR71922.1 aldo/keto reductase family protein [Hamadaea sp.]NUT18225.1 aldo/keto reductase family protein [Hamadaea sp.]
MEHRPLGRSGLQVSAITFGSWLTHDSAAADSAKATLRTALDVGITTFDTADVYGRPEFGAAEELLGEALHGVRRESLEILTKVCLRTGPGANDEGLSRKHILESCNASLRRLRTDYVDLYQAHRFDPKTPLEETMTAFADLVRQGKVLYIGVSEWTAAQIEAGAALARELRMPLISNQPQYSMLWRVIEAEVVPASLEGGLGQIVFSPVAQGVLTGKYLPGTQPPAGSRAASDKGSAFVGRYLADPVLRAVQRVKPIADELGVTMAQLAVAWVLSRPGVSAAIVGASRPEQLAENVAALDVKLDAETLARIDAALVDPVHGDLVERDPAKTAKPFDVMPAWRR